MPAAALDGGCQVGRSEKRKILPADEDRPLVRPAVMSGRDHAAVALHRFDTAVRRRGRSGETICLHARLLWFQEPIECTKPEARSHGAVFEIGAFLCEPVRTPLSTVIHVEVEYRRTSTHSSSDPSTCPTTTRTTRRGRSSREPALRSPGSRRNGMEGIL